MATSAVQGKAPADVLLAVWKAWQVRNKTAILELAANDVVYAIYVPSDILPFGGETVGKAALSDRLQSMIDQFEVLEYEGTVVGINGDMVRGQVSYRFRHRVTGEVSEGTMRHVVQVQDGLVKSFKTYKDVAGIRAVMNVVAQVAADERKKSTT